MGEIDELRARVIASMPVATNPNPNGDGRKVDESKEEGELSSSDDEALITSKCIALATSNAAETHTVGMTSGIGLSSSAGKCLPKNNPASSFGALHFPTTVNYNKHVEKKQLLSKPSNYPAPGGHALPDSNASLVINFSEESDSDSEEGQPTEAKVVLETKDKTSGLVGRKRPEAPALPKSNVVSLAGNNRLRMTPKKTPSTPAFISTVSQIKNPCSRTFQAPLSERDLYFQKHESLNKTIASRKREYIRIADSTKNELENLRQRIAIRENELKLKNVPQGKERGPTSDDGSRPTKLASVGALKSVHNKLNNKRQKVEGPSDCKLNMNGEQRFLVSDKSNVELTKKVMDGKDKGKYTDLLVKLPNFASTEMQGGNSCLGASMGEGYIKHGAKLNISSKLAEETACTDGRIARLEGIPSAKKISAEGQQFPVLEGPSTTHIFPQKSDSQHATTELVMGNFLQGAEGQQLPITLEGTNTSPIFLQKSNSQHGLLRSSKHHVVKSGDSKYRCTTSEAFDASADNRNLFKYMDHVHVLTDNRLKSLTKEEELLDKALEDAQELRRKCELEEKSALKAYRKAQRALIDANNQCNYLYCQRELLSAQLRALLMDESSSSWSSRLNKQKEIELGSFMEDSKADGDQLPNLSCQAQVDCDEILDRERSEANVLQTGFDPSDMPFQYLTGPQIEGSTPGSEPDASTSELGTQYAANIVSTPSNLPALSADEDEETFPSERKQLRSSLASETKVDSFKKGVGGVREELAVKSAFGNMQDLVSLEASLRYELFARLGGRTLALNSGIDRVANCNANNYKDDIKVRNLPIPSDEGFMELVQSQMADAKGKEGSERVSGQCQFDRSCDDYGSRGSIDAEESTSSLKEFHGPNYTSMFSLPSPNLKVTFRHLKDVVPDICDIFLTRKYDIPRIETKQNGFRDDVVQMLATKSKIESLVSSAHDPTINPFWPLCMFEFRGICNDGKCPWQHARDYHKKNSKKLILSPMSDAEVEPALSHCKAADEQSILYYQNYLAVPTYWIGPHHIEVDSFSSGCLFARSVWQYSQSGFCTFFGMPFLMQRVLPPDVPCLCSRDGHAGNHKSWKGQSFYNQIQDGSMKQLMQGSNDSERCLELAIDMFNKSAHKLEEKEKEKEKALAVLSRCLEADPKSVVLWVVYLHMFYRKGKSLGKDDMFQLAIQYNGDSYELWLLYINSRMQLHSRLEAYDTALKEFISKPHSSKDSKHTSSCLVDLMLQMLDFLCMSGNVDKAILRINELLCPAPSDSSSQTAISEILDCVTVPEKCTLWVCLVYLVVYKKLPEAVLQKFEFKQELPSGIEWPPIQLTVEEKGQALNLMKKAVHSVVSVNGGSSAGDNVEEAAVWAVQLLTVNHVRCVAALEDFCCSKDLLVRYIELYPTCFELSLMRARMQKDCLEQVAGFEGFEEVLQNWPKGEPGIQCIWNQYAEFALENATVTLVKNLMVRWFKTFHTVQNIENKEFIEREEDFDGPSVAPSLANHSSGFHFMKRDEMFGLLNLSLYQVLHDNLTEAQVALDKAFKLALGVDFILCIKARAIFQIFYAFDLIKDNPAFIIGYLTDTRASAKYELLSRRFLRSIKRSRNRVLVENFLGPASVDSSVINSMLEILYGPSLLPDNFDKLENLVDVVEALMLILPANYRLGLSVCKLIQSQKFVGVASASFKFWLSSLLVNSIFQAIPVAPEQVWVEAADVLSRLDMGSFPDKFHELAVLVYPFSVKLWQSYYKFRKRSGNEDSIIEAARERGIILG
ncbi:uncharacterized protein [Aristolochia californica]|uniref:uncharacterized protein isoform X2 n=1 Tax=Aristolochia californica TaxID=171875 RepID=UPI0035DF46EF